MTELLWSAASSFIVHMVIECVCVCVCINNSEEGWISKYCEVFSGIYCYCSLELLKGCDPNPARRETAVYMMDKTIRVYIRKFD